MDHGSGPSSSAGSSPVDTDPASVSDDQQLVVPPATDGNNNDNKMNPNNGISNGTGSRAHTPEPVRQIRVVVQPPTHVLSGERFNRPLVVLGPLEAAYYVVNAVDPGTGNTAQLIQPGRLASPPPPPPAHDNANNNHDSEDEAQQQSNNGLEVRAQMLRVGVRSAPILDGYDTPSERYYDADEERPGFGYAVWTDLAITSVGPGWKIWIRAMNERDEPLCAVETVSVNVQDLDAMLPHPQPETFGKLILPTPTNESDLSFFY
ncbi:hypothetical protein PG988_008170 [Apiospora saccharicola]